MSFLVFLASFALFAAAVTFLCLALGVHKLDGVKNAPPPSFRERFSPRWLAVSVLCAAVIPVLFVTLFVPLKALEERTRVEGFVKRTFQKKLGKQPDSIDVTRVQVRAGDEDWRYAGTARAGVEVWEVTVTRTSKHFGGTQVGDAELTCTLSLQNDSPPGREAKSMAHGSDSN